MEIMKMVCLLVTACALCLCERSAAEKVEMPYTYIYLVLEKDDVVLKGDNLTEILHGVYKQFGVDLVCNAKTLVRISPDAKAKVKDKNLKSTFIAKGYMLKGKNSLAKVLSLVMDMHGLGCKFSPDGVTAYSPDAAELKDEVVELKMIRTAVFDEIIGVDPSLANEEYAKRIYEALAKFGNDIDQPVILYHFDVNNSVLTLKASPDILSLLNAKLYEKIMRTK